MKKGYPPPPPFFAKVLLCKKLGKGNTCKVLMAQDLELKSSAQRTYESNLHRLWCKTRKFLQIQDLVDLAKVIRA